MSLRKNLDDEFEDLCPDKIESFLSPEEAEELFGNKKKIEEKNEGKKEANEINENLKIDPFDSFEGYRPAKLAVIHIQRFFEDKRYQFKSVTKSAHLKKQSSSDGIVFYTFFDTESNSYIHVFYPVSDSDKPNEGTIPLKHALEIYKMHLKKYDDKSQHKLSIPVATTFFRQHWLELFIEDKTGSHQYEACLTDSRTKEMGGWYPTRYIKKAVSLLNAELTFKYTGGQNKKNDTHCGIHFLQNSIASLKNKLKQTIDITRDIFNKHETIFDAWSTQIKAGEVSDLGKVKCKIPCNPNHELDKPKDIQVFTYSVEKFPKSYEAIWNKYNNKYDAALALLADYSKTTETSGHFVSSLKLFFTFHWSRHYTDPVHELVKSEFNPKDNQLRLKSVKDLLEALSKLVKSDGNPFFTSLDVNSSLGKRIRFIQERTKVKVFDDSFFTNDPKEVNKLEGSFLKYRRNLN